MHYRILEILKVSIDSVALLRRASVDLIAAVEQMQETAIIAMTPGYEYLKEYPNPAYQCKHFDYNYNSPAFVEMIKMLNKRNDWNPVYSLIKGRLLKAKEIAAQVMDYHFERIPKLVTAYRDYIQFPSTRDFAAFRSAFCRSFPNFSFYKQWSCNTSTSMKFASNTFNVRMRKAYRAFMKYMQTEYLPQRGLEMDTEVYSLIKNHL